MARTTTPRDDDDETVGDTPAAVSDIDSRVTDYDTIAEDTEYPPFPYKLAGTVRRAAWPLASTKRDMQTALNENRTTDLCRLIFGSDWPDVSLALDDLGPGRGDDAQTHLVLDYLDHVGVNEQATERWRANRQQKRDARRVSSAAGRRRRS